MWEFLGADWDAFWKAFWDPQWHQAWAGWGQVVATFVAIAGAFVLGRRDMVAQRTRLDIEIATTKAENALARARAARNQGRVLLAQCEMVTSEIRFRHALLNAGRQGLPADGSLRLVQIADFGLSGSTSLPDVYQLVASFEGVLVDAITDAMVAIDTYQRNIQEDIKKMEGRHWPAAHYRIHLEEREAQLMRVAAKLNALVTLLHAEFDPMPAQA